MNVVRRQQEASDKPTKPSPYFSNDPADIAWRRQQMAVDNDIEGVANNAELEALVADWDKNNVPVEERIEHLNKYFSKS